MPELSVSAGKGSAGRLLRCATGREPRAARRQLSSTTYWLGTALTSIALFLGLLAGSYAQTVQHDGTVPTARGFGTGFYVDSDGLFVTSLHVVATARKIRLDCTDLVRHATVVDSSPAHDLAVLKTVGLRPRAHLRFADPKSLRIGDSVFTIGFPTPGILGPQPKFTEGTISALSGLGQASLLQISVPIQPGNSGGALIDQHGEVVGVIVAQVSDQFFVKSSGSAPQNVNFAAKAEHAKSLFPGTANVGGDGAWLLGSWHGQEGLDRSAVNPPGDRLHAARFEFFRLEDEIRWTMTAGGLSATGVARRVSEARVELVGSYNLRDGSPGTSPGTAVEYQLERRDNNLQGYGSNARGDRLAAILRRARDAAQRPRVKIDRSAAIQRAVDATCLVTAEE